MKQYKVWVEIEEVDYDTDEYNSHITEPMELEVFETLEEAVAFQSELHARYWNDVDHAVHH